MLQHCVTLAAHQIRDPQRVLRQNPFPNHNSAQHFSTTDFIVSTRQHLQITMSPAEPPPQPPIEMALLPPKSQPGSQPPTTSPFLSLPPSIRQKIYLLLLHPHPSPIIIYRAPLPTPTPPSNPYHTPPPAPHRPHHRNPHPQTNHGPLHATLLPLFLTSRLISTESRHTFYTTTTFSIPPATVWPLSWARLPLMTRWFVDRIGRDNALALRHLVVPFPICSERIRRDWLGNGRGRGLLPGLAAAAPNLRVLEFEPRSGAEVEGVLGACPVGVQTEVVCAWGEALGEEFAAAGGSGLEEVVLGVYDLVYSCQVGRNRVAEVFRAVVRGCPGWRVKECGPAPGVCLGVVRRGVPAVPVLPEGVVVGEDGERERREREEEEERWRCLVEEEPKGRWARWMEVVVGRWKGKEDREGGSRIV
ncbi:hypothetical protein QBC39DRAFT_408001 [Podospora conica]|nr:hypothetical protein QBC39DRAFT_408001 [Schizothecium conicum]